MSIIKQPWSLPESEIFEQLETSSVGLTEKEAEARRLKYGDNTFHSKEKINIVSIFLKQFLSPLIFLLISAAIITSFLYEWINTIVISFAVLLNVFLGFFHEYHAENTLNKLKSYIKERARVIRDGKEEEIDSSLLVPGDVIKLFYGFRVPADSRILSENNFSVDEAILTGESMPVEKKADMVSISASVTERKNIAHSGTLIVQGYATGVVYATGNHTEIGKIAGIVSKIDRVQTPFKKGIDRLAWIIFYLTITIVSGILILGVFQGQDLLHMLVLSVAIAVGAVPEALPIVLTIILATGATRIASKKGIVRKLTAAETLGSTTVIMTDKTGTLTLADMQLVGVYAKDMFSSTEAHKEDQKAFSHEQKKLLGLALYNTDVSIENKNEDKKNWIFRGRPFEVNIAKACLRHNVPLDSVESVSSYIVLPFNSTNKFSVASHDEKYIVMGAPDILLKRSDISKEEYLKIENWIENTSKHGKRLVALATMPDKHSKKNVSSEEIKDLNFMGIFVFHDPIRPEVPSAIKNIESHGVKIKLVTGDLKGTALAVAESLGWKVEEDEALTGSEINSLSDEELLAVIQKIKIFARVTPEDKLRIGKLYQKQGEIVAMTGDGVNDAPALKAMDIGISLGSGSDVAKSAADLVLLDDNFKTISMAIDEGRRILSNIRKAIVFLMSNSLDGIFVITGSFFLGLPLPITALQIIWVNLFTGSLPALAFAFDEDIDKTKNAGKDLRLIFTKEVKYLAFGIGTLTSLLLFVFYYFMLRVGIDLEVARSIFFVCFSSYVLVIAFSFRSLNNPIFSYDVFSNKKLNLSILVAVGLLVFTMTVPFMREVFTLAKLPLYSIPIIVVWLGFNVLLVEGAKYLIHRKMA